MFRPWLHLACPQTCRARVLPFQTLVLPEWFRVRRNLGARRAPVRCLWRPAPDRSGSGDGVSRERGDVQAREALMRRRQRAPDIDGATGVLDDGHGKVLSPRVLGRVADAEVEREPGDKDARETALAQIT